MVKRLKTSELKSFFKIRILSKFSLSFKKLNFPFDKMFIYQVTAN